MHRLKRHHALILASALLLSSLGGVIGCAGEKPHIRDQLVVEQLRLRITKVRHAVAETRAVIASSRGAPYLPEIHMRLAELLSEEARYHYMVAYEREQKSTKSLHVPQVRFLKEQAIATYESILSNYPDTHLADRILFNISHEQRELGEFDKMRKALERLVKEHPQSPYKTEALLVLGDFYFDKLQFAQAQSYYNDIAKENQGPLVGLAHYKLGWVDVNLSNCKHALYNFEKAIKVTRRAQKKADEKKKKKKDTRKALGAQLQGEFAIPTPEEEDQQFAGHKSVDVQREALVDLTYCYAQERKPEKAVPYLRSLASSREAYVAALAKMANRYALIEQPRGAAEVARELLRLAPDEEDRLDDARMLHTAITRMKDYSQVGEDAKLVLTAARRQLLKPALSHEAAELLRSEFELISRDMATKSHELLTNESARGSNWTKHPATPAQTAAAYTAYLDAYPDSPNAEEVVLNLADVLMEGKSYLEAGHRYRQAAAMLAKDPPEEPEKESTAKAEKTAKKPKKDPAAIKAQRKADRLDSLYEAVVAYQSTLDSIESRTHFERAAARAGLRDAGGLYLEAGVADAERAKKIKFAIAQSFYDEGNYIEAIDLLTAVAYEYPNDEQGKASVHMVLDSYRTINDISGLINAGRRFIAEGSPIPQDVRAQVSPIVAAAEQNRLDELSLAASGDQVGGMEILLAFADRYKNTDLGERAMLSAFVAARAAGNADQLYTLGDQVLSQFPNSEQVGGVVSTMGRTAASRFEFDRAIQYLEQAASINEDQRASLLITAGELREQLSDTGGAMKNYQDALEASGEGGSKSDAMAHMANLIERIESPAEVVRFLTPLSETMDPEVSSRLGLALLRQGRADEAEEQLRNVVEGALDASPSAQARANYGMAEIMLKLLEGFDPPAGIDAIEELVGIVDVVLQSYLAAARQADPVFSQAALARLARASEVGAEKLEAARMPSELSAQEAELVKSALENRAAQMRRDQEEILKECAQRASASFILDEAGLACLNGGPAQGGSGPLPLPRPAQEGLGQEPGRAARQALQEPRGSGGPAGGGNRLPRRRRRPRSANGPRPHGRGRR